MQETRSVLKTNCRDSLDHLQAMWFRSFRSELSRVMNYCRGLREIQSEFLGIWIPIDNHKISANDGYGMRQSTAAAQSGRIQCNAVFYRVFVLPLRAIAGGRISIKRESA